MTANRATRLLGALALGLLAGVWASVPAWAQQATAVAPEYVSSEPAEGATMHEAPDEVRVTFSEPLDPSSTLSVTDECDNQIDDGQVEVLGTDMTVGIEQKPAGKYTVAYTAVGLAGATGTNEGDFAFTVHGGKDCAGGDDHHHGGGGNGGNGNGHGNHNGNGGGHTGHDGDDGDGDHTDHGDAGDHGGMHAMDGHTAGGHRDHNGPGHGDHHGRHKPTDGDMGDRDEDDDVVDIAAPGDTTSAELPADRDAALLAFAAAALFGILGGWLLRVSGSRS